MLDARRLRRQNPTEWVSTIVIHCMGVKVRRECSQDVDVFDLRLDVQRS
jgi:hypothetical protein